MMIKRTPLTEACWRRLSPQIWAELRQVLGRKSTIINHQVLAIAMELCATREDTQAQRWVTTCTDGSRAVTKYDAQAQRWYTDIVRAPKGDKAPRGWPIPGKPPR
jgi:hypothetical protein